LEIPFLILFIVSNPGMLFNASVIEFKLYLNIDPFKNFDNIPDFFFENTSTTYCK